ncbi:MAG TPA: DUF456 domain-containing protein [Xanthomonadaceae bacterium]|jgi:uncharacterized protein YqgC (DUF456 family)|nr:DUF456 domain-containing protein [Xanthomonadaceae bacterium]
MDTTVWLYVLAGALVFIGLLGTFLPVLPGMPLIFGGMLLAAWVGDFQIIGGWTLLVLGLMSLLALGIDFIATAMGAKRAGASGKAVLGAAIGTLFGLLFGIIGLLVGPFVGAVAGELIHRRAYDNASVGEAARVGAATWIGLAVAAALKLAVAFSMLGIFALAIWL